MPRSSLWALIIFTSTLTFVNGQQANVQHDDCMSQENCAACIRAANCAWCNVVVNESVTKSPERCVNRKRIDPSLPDRWCDHGEIINPMNKATFIKNDSLCGTKCRSQVQIQPQIVKLKLRRGEEHRFTLRYRQAEDYPVDLYFVADLSWSMRPFWTALSKLGDQIVETMKKLTSNFRLGFGSFIDKNIRPMVREQHKWDRIYHYSFRNDMALTKKTADFKNKVANAKVNGNSDNPEGGLDGVMQAMVCRDEIGWRSNARHILVYASDDSPHIAGDGRFAGLPQPNDERCHLNTSRYYSYAELQDYPSIGQIGWQANENNINIIFIVNKEFKKIYDAMQSLIPGSSVGILGVNSDNIVQLISSHYEKLVRSLKMTSNSTSKFLDVKFFSRCRDKDGELQQTDKCDGIRVNVTVEFEVVIKAMDCPEREEDWHQTIEIKPEGINEGVVVNVELICGCECSKKSDKGKNAPRAKECNNHGVLDCGICSCDQDHFGEWCQCEGSQDKANTDDLIENCRMNNASNICSGRGKCICGSCSCNEIGNSGKKYYNKFCQCEDFSCGSHAGKLCGGHGRCQCGNCACDSGWTGDTCECAKDTSLCHPPGNDAKICSGAGECICGECQCDKNMGRRGRFCEDCPSCPSQRYDEFKDCVECVIHKSGKIFAVDPSCGNCSSYDVRPVDEIEDDSDKRNPEDYICRIAGDDGSTFVFKYVYGNGDTKTTPTIFADKNKAFRVIDDFLAATIGVVGLTLLLGFLILLIWKIVTYLHDKREWEKFMKERAETTWGGGANPLYRGAVTAVRNPTFNDLARGEDIEL